jgi:uncharacterized protein YdaU (DUF1376 family)
MAKDPAFLFYSNDFLTGTMTLTFEDRGKYITLLCLMHQQGRLSEDTIKFIIGDISSNLMSKFSRDVDGNWFNKRLEEEADRRNKFTESRRNNAKKKVSTSNSTSNSENEALEKHMLQHMETENTLVLYNNKINKENENLKNSNLFRQPNIPNKNQVWEYFSGAGGTKDMAKAFYDKHDGTGWFINGSPIVKWQSLANSFITNWNKIEEQRKNKGISNNDQSKVQTLRKLPSSPTQKYD